LLLVLWWSPGGGAVKGQRSVRRGAVSWVVDTLGHLSLDELFGVQEYLGEIVALRQSGDTRWLRLSDRFGGQGELVEVRRVG
jgi:hypothetical protein